MRSINIISFTRTNIIITATTIPLIASVIFTLLLLSVIITPPVFLHTLHARRLFNSAFVSNGPRQALKLL